MGNPWRFSVNGWETHGDFAGKRWKNNGNKSHGHLGKDWKSGLMFATGMPHHNSKIWHPVRRNSTVYY